MLICSYAPMLICSYAWRSAEEAVAHRSAAPGGAAC